MLSGVLAHYKKQDVAWMHRRRLGEGVPTSREPPPLGALTQLQRRFMGDGSSEGTLPPWHFLFKFQKLCKSASS